MAPKENLETQDNENIAQCNFNNYVLVKLTEHWVKSREKYFQELWLNIKDNPLKIDQKWYLRIQLRELMQIFWKEMFNWNPNIPFEMNFKIEIEPKENWIKKVISSAQKDSANILN